MKRHLCIAALCLLGLTGCASEYIITTNDGQMLTSYGKVIPEGQTRARRTKRTADVVDLDSRRSPKKAADRVASLEAALRGYRKALEGMTGNDELTRYRRTFMERSVKRTEQALKQMRKAAS